MKQKFILNEKFILLEADPVLDAERAARIAPVNTPLPKITEFEQKFKDAADSYRLANNPSPSAKREFEKKTEELWGQFLEVTFGKENAEFIKDKKILAPIKLEVNEFGFVPAGNPFIKYLKSILANSEIKQQINNIKYGTIHNAVANGLLDKKALKSNDNIIYTADLYTKDANVITKYLRLQSTHSWVIQNLIKKGEYSSNIGYFCKQPTLVVNQNTSSELFTIYGSSSYYLRPLNEVSNEADSNDEKTDFADDEQKSIESLKGILKTTAERNEAINFLVTKYIDNTNSNEITNYLQSQGWTNKSYTFPANETAKYFGIFRQYEINAKNVLSIIKAIRSIDTGTK